MNIEDYIAIAHNHFVSRHDTSQMKQLFHQYASEELEKTGTELASFVELVMDGEADEASQEDYNRFYTWYYLNHVACPVTEGWNARIYNPTLQDIVTITIEPVKIRQEEGQTEVLPCTTTEAQYWSVYAKEASGQQYCIADCDSESTALMVKQAVGHVADQWHIRLLIDMKDQQLHQLLTTHPIDYMLVDRDLLSSHRDQMDVKRTTLPRNAQVGLFYQHFQSPDPQESYIERLVKLSCF